MYLLTWKSCMASGDAGELRRDVAEVDQHEEDKYEQRGAKAELFANEVAETFAGDRAHARAHLLHDDERDGDGDHGPEERVAVLRAGLGVGEDAAGVVIDVGGDEAGAEDREHEQDGGSHPPPGPPRIRFGVRCHPSTLQVGKSTAECLGGGAVRPVGRGCRRGLRR